MVISLGIFNTKIAGNDETGAKKSFVLSYTEYNSTLDRSRLIMSGEHVVIHV